MCAYMYIVYIEYASYSAWLCILNHYIHNYHIIYAIVIHISAYNTNISKLFNMHIVSIYVFINTFLII